MKTTLAVVIVAVLAFAGFFFTLRTSRVEVDLGNHVTITADIAATDASREQGLSGKDTLKENTGLFFVFDYDSYWGIWMKDMKFSIDVLWFDADGTVVGLVENMSPQSYPKVFFPEESARYVLEMPIKTIEKSGIQMGAHVQIKK